MYQVAGDIKHYFEFLNQKTSLCKMNPAVQASKCSFISKNLSKIKSMTSNLSCLSQILEDRA